MFVILESKLYLRKVWRYQRGNQKPTYIEGQTTQWSKDRRTDNTMVQRQKDRQHNGQKTEGQTTQWSKDRRTDNTMVKRQKDRQHNGQKTEGQTTQWSKEKGQKNKQLFTKHYTENYRPINTNHTKTGGEPWCFGRKSSSCSTSGTCRGTLVTNPVIFHE